MDIIFLLHFYQPHNQQDDILNRIVNESYRPLIEGFLKRPKAKVVINITGALSMLLKEKGYEDVLLGIRKLCERGQVELTASSMYHGFLPLLPESEITRQIKLNTQANRKYIGKCYEPEGFFSPEMAISKKVIEVAQNNGFSWIAAPQLANPMGESSPNKLYAHEINIMFRNKRVSSLILSSLVRDSQSLIKETNDLHKRDKYWFCVMDAETFGHHRIGHEKVLFEILDDNFFNPITVSDLLKQNLDTEPVGVRDCTWTNTEQDFHLEGEVNSFVLWKDPKNPIHKLQWGFVNFVLKTLESYKNKESKEYKDARNMVDEALASDQFWWASVKPWWSLEMIEQGAFELKNVIQKLNIDVHKADDYYRGIMDIAFEWQRSGLIRKKHLENSATYMKEPFRDRTPSEWHNQIIIEFEDEMLKAAKNREYERAIKWRDAILKIEQGNDMHDVLHVVDELWSARNVPSLKPFLEYDWEEFSDFVKRNFKDAPSKEEFDNWKKRKKSTKN